MSDFTVTPTSIYPSRSRSSGLRSQDDPASLIITHQNVDSNKISPPLELHTPNKNLLAPPRNIFTAMKSAPNVAVPIEASMCPVSGSPNGDTPGSRVYRPVVPYRGSEIRKPPPLLFRPTTFWRKTRRSGVTGASYSPSSFLVRRSTFIAAGLSQDMPGFDLSAFGVESRVSFLVLAPDYGI